MTTSTTDFAVVLILISIGCYICIKSALSSGKLDNTDPLGGFYYLIELATMIIITSLICKISFEKNINLSYTVVGFFLMFIPSAALCEKEIHGLISKLFKLDN